jgi:diguanylate cyclase (GGDEF)-like protein
VDDTPENITILMEILQDQYNLSVAVDGATALEIAVSEGPPDLILLDIMMPGIDGYEVCKRLKSDPKTADIPVIFVTAMSEVEDEAKGLVLGAIDYIRKPISPAIVSARVKNHLELKRHRDLLKDLSSIDGLTSIANRRRFDDTLAQEWSRCIRSSQPIALIMIDIDFFKEYNDNYGHLAGDDCLKLVAQTLESSVRRAGDLVARYGGEEFVVLLPETNLDGAIVVADTLKKEIEALNITHAFSEVADKVSVSMGVTSSSPHVESSQETLIKAADEALYKAKENGRNQIRTQAV